MQDIYYNPDFSYFELSYVFLEHNDSVGRGTTVLQMKIIDQKIDQCTCFENQSAGLLRFVSLDNWTVTQLTLKAQKTYEIQVYFIFRELLCHYLCKKKCNLFCLVFCMSINNYVSCDKNILFLMGMLFEIYLGGICSIVWPQWWSFADVCQQGLHFSKKISKRKIFLWFDFYRCSHGSSKSA